jgi:hypothetical protein
MLSDPEPGEPDLIVAVMRGSESNKQQCINVLARVMFEFCLQCLVLLEMPTSHKQELFPKSAMLICRIHL